MTFADHDQKCSRFTEMLCSMEIYEKPPCSLSLKSPLAIALANSRIELMDGCMVFDDAPIATVDSLSIYRVPSELFDLTDRRVMKSRE
jgi:hypothetical protein